jgi:predicted phage terminase large subunit-like protein
MKRLIINMPPRSLKSIMASVSFPAFVLGHDPTRRIICVSYSGDLAKKHANDFRAVLESPWYKRLFPATRIGQKDSEIEIELTERGFRLATSVGGTLTGRGEIIVIDDPLKPDDAYSEAKRSAANEWFRNTLTSRLDDKRTGAIVIVMQRVHMDDLTGFVQTLSDDWEALKLPAIAEIDEDIPISDTKVYHRKAGEALSPEREPIPLLESLKLQLGGDAFSAQYQQEPAPPGGVMIKRAWIKRYSELPPRDRRLLVVQSWDTASKGGLENDFSVYTTWIVTRDQQSFLLDVWRKRVDYPELKAAAQALAERHNAQRVLVEDAGAGTSLVQELRTKIPGIIAVKPDRDKVSRMSVVSSKFEAGQVFIPERAPWLADFEAELFSFPGSRHDDQCDSVSQALSEGNVQFPMRISRETLERARRPGPRTWIEGFGYLGPDESVAERFAVRIHSAPPRNWAKLWAFSRYSRRSSACLRSSPTCFAVLSWISDFAAAAGDEVAENVGAERLLPRRQAVQDLVDVLSRYLLHAAQLFRQRFYSQPFRFAAAFRCPQLRHRQLKVRKLDRLLRARTNRIADLLPPALP